MFMEEFGYRTTDAVLILLGANINSFMVGYSYDISVNKFSNISWGTHEIMLRYCYIFRHRRSRNQKCTLVVINIF
jgi:hypothetical protein